MSLDIALNRINKQSLIAASAAASIFLLIILGLFFYDSWSLSSQAYHKNYEPFRPKGPFAAALKILPNDRDLAARKLAELDSKSSPAIDARRLYILAQINQRSGNSKEAFEQYSAINLRSIPYLADRVLLHKAEIAAETGDEKTVMDSCNRIIHDYHQSLSVPSARYELARSLLRQSKFNEAEKQFSRVRRSYPDSQQAIGASYYLGQIQNSNIQKRNQYWQEYLQVSPNGRFTNEILEAWSRSLDQLSPLQKSLMGLAYYEQGKKEEALNYLGFDLNQKTWFPLAQLQLNAKQKPAAHKTLLEGLGRFPDSPHYESAVNLLFHNSSVTEINNYAPALISSAKNEIIPFIIWRQAAYNSGDTKRALLRKIEADYPSSFWAGKASGEIFWEAYKSENYDLAKQLGQAHIIKYGVSPEAAKVKFWLAKRAEAEGDIQRARGLYNQILVAHETSYYAFRSKGRLAELNGASDPGWNISNSSEINLLSHLNDKDEWTWPLPTEDIRQLHPTLQDLFTLNLWQEALSLLPDNYEKKYPALHAWLLVMVEDRISEAVNVAAEQLNRRKSPLAYDHGYWLISYPLVYSKYTFESARKYGVDPLLVQSLMRQESRFQHKVVSSAKAIGLCQLMPATAKEVARSIGYPLPSFDDLCTPKYNIELGTKYLSGLMKQFNGRAQLAIAAYNGGPGSVSKWLKANPNRDPDLFVELIPFQETQKYVINVFQNYWIYSNLVDRIYGRRQALNQPSNSSLDSIEAVDFISTT